MMFMPGNNASALVKTLAQKHPGKLGWLNTPSCWKQPPEYMPYACDNDAFSAYTNRTAWDVKAWRAMLAKTKSARRPLWVLVPDVVGDKMGTLRLWAEYYEEAADYGPLAFACQDGMTPNDVPDEAEVIFVGGTTHWKWHSLPMWVKHFPRVHVGRVNMLRRLWTCQKLGVESCDGTGFLRESMDGKRVQGLVRWVGGETDPQHELTFCP